MSRDLRAAYRRGVCDAAQTIKASLPDFATLGPDEAADLLETRIGVLLRAADEKAKSDEALDPALLGTAHGHVRPRPDGVKARCGGPGLCNVCRRERAALEGLSR
jgi:hypothetical protein